MNTRMMRVVAGAAMAECGLLIGKCKAAHMKLGGRMSSSVNFTIDFGVVV